MITQKMKHGSRIYVFISVLLLTFYLPIKNSHAQRNSQPGETYVKEMTADERLLYGAEKREIQHIKSALQNGADIDARDKWGQTALHKAIDDVEIVSLLITHGADVNAKNAAFGMTALYYADCTVAQLLIDAGADIDVRSQNGNTPLMWHVYNENYDVANLLSKNGASSDAENINGDTAAAIAQRFSGN